MTKNIKRIAIIAGEASGDKIGADLIKKLSRVYQLEIFGIGGAELSSLGLKSLFPYEDLSLIGPWAILKNIRELNKKLKFTIKAIASYKPDILIIIDSPEFTQRVAKNIKKHSPNIPIINYVPPLVWVWRSYRAKFMKKYITYILSIYPFEPEIYKELDGPPSLYVGNTLFDNILEKENLKSTNNSENKVILFMPGSRASEIDKLLEPSIESFNYMASSGQKFKIKIPTFEKYKNKIEKSFSEYNLDIDVVIDEQEKIKCFYSADVALVASGSATLELSAAKLPMVVIYKLNILNSIFAFLLNLNKHFISLPNLILKKNLVPELVQKDCNSINISKNILELLNNETKRRYQMDGFNEIHKIMKRSVDAKKLEDLFNTYLS
jgi:lipid-A-disaccharide synthase